MDGHGDVYPGSKVVEYSKRFDGAFSPEFREGAQYPGIPNPVSYATPNPDPKMSRVTDTDVLAYKLMNGEFVEVPPLVNAQTALVKFLNFVMGPLVGPSPVYCLLETPFKCFGSWPVSAEVPVVSFPPRQSGRVEAATGEGQFPVSSVDGNAWPQLRAVFPSAEPPITVSDRK